MFKMCSLVYDYSGRCGEAAVLLDQQTQFLRQVPEQCSWLSCVPDPDLDPNPEPDPNPEHIHVHAKCCLTSRQSSSDRC